MNVFPSRRGTPEGAPPLNSRSTAPCSCLSRGEGVAIRTLWHEVASVCGFSIRWSMESPGSLRPPYPRHPTWVTRSLSHAIEGDPVSVFVGEAPVDPAEAGGRCTGGCADYTHPGGNTDVRDSSAVPRSSHRGHWSHELPVYPGFAQCELRVKSSPVCVLIDAERVDDWGPGS